MSDHPPTGSRGRSAVESITNLESLCRRDDVPVHEERDVVDEATFDAVASLEDVAVVGVTNEDGEVLLRKLTDDCDWKLPLGVVSPGEDYAEVAREAVETVVEFRVTLDGIEGVWCYELRLENGERTTSRRFVVFSASPADGETDAALAPIAPESEGPAGVDWFDELPDGAAQAPGTRSFFD